MLVVRMTHCLQQEASLNLSVDDFRSVSRTKKSSHNVFDSSAYSTLESASELHEEVLKMFKSGMSSSFTKFDSFLEELAQSGRLLRHYTQNIDCRYSRLDCLASKTVWLHGRADTLRCHKAPGHRTGVDPQSFERLVTTPCTKCEMENKSRQQEEKRTRRGGFFRTDVLLYGEHSPDESDFLEVFQRDLQQPIDALIVVGTRLRIHSLKQFVRQVCKVVRLHSTDGMTVWVNKLDPKPKELRSSIKHEFLGDCDDFASLICD
ncbi:DHS-like NAD/FAD-binding domain-containing protein [Dactylonectria macrodidyma]|uniref:DHS-like NAD/FAD-binding domain-containing protein n=1 Tax=Dactylonectria macrodidyma TaxID=307937 RepID=A0A9P9D2W3_9HYPO|nr:DHS-like NAD/FAD-binding domain-containing protein [Dactylonectria macrodidyma]